jgi:hypothetical protein
MLVLTAHSVVVIAWPLESCMRSYVVGSSIPWHVFADSSLAQSIALRQYSWSLLPRYMMRKYSPSGSALRSSWSSVSTVLIWSNLIILQNIIPTFTLVYVGLNNTDYSQPKEHVRQVPSTSRLAVVRPYQPCEVLDIKPQSAEEKDGECVWDGPDEWWFCIILIIASTISDKLPICVKPSIPCPVRLHTDTGGK